ncbi:hypothetical protein Taro_035892, partial [Colocasia esculenta]|nr:hypothetical protein [Colocasia esculenta]
LRSSSSNGTSRRRPLSRRGPVPARGPQTRVYVHGEPPSRRLQKEVPLLVVGPVSWGPDCLSSLSREGVLWRSSSSSSSVDAVPWFPEGRLFVLQPLLEPRTNMSVVSALGAILGEMDIGYSHWIHAKRSVIAASSSRTPVAVAVIKKMEGCDCIDPQWPVDELLVKYQFFSDFFIAFAYFSIPLELIYFVKKSSFFPYRWVLMLFGAFIILCGATHLISLWTFTAHSKTLAIVMTIAKGATAVVSCITALMLVHIIPDLLSVKTREVFLKNKAEELDREMGLIRTQEETGRHVRMLTHEIRSTLDRRTILQTTLIELGRTLGLEECALWMPSRNGLNLQLSHTLRHPILGASVVPINLPIVNQVFSSNHATRIPHTCPLAQVFPLAGRYVPPEVVAVRVPLLHLTNFQINDWPELSARSYAVMVLMLPLDSARKWHIYELELVEVVADQHLRDYNLYDVHSLGLHSLLKVAVALSHAAILEESMRARDQLMEQNLALDRARREAEMAICARNDFLAVMNHEMRTPIHAIIALCPLLLETDLTPEQRLMIETILKSSNLLATLINDVLDLSLLEDGSLEMETVTFNLHSVFQEVINMIKPIAAVKKLSVSLSLSPDLPLCAVGDEKRLMQIILNIVGNAVKFTREGNILVEASVAKPNTLKEVAPLEFFPMFGDGHFNLHVEVG